MRSRIVTSLLILTLGIVAYAQVITPPPDILRTITVSASAERDVQPDLAVVSLAVDSRAATVADAVTDNNKRTDAAIATVKALNIAGLTLKTRDFTVRPIYPSDTGRGTTYPYGTTTPYAPTAPGTAATTTPQVTTYSVQNALEIRIPQPAPATAGGTDTTTDGLASVVGKVIDAALKAGADQVSYVSFQLADDTNVNLELLAEATRKAAISAAAIAKGAGVTLGDVEYVTNGWSSPYSNTSAYGTTYPYGATSPYSTSLSPTMEPGTLTMSASVSASYLIK